MPISAAIGNKPKNAIDQDEYRRIYAGDVGHGRWWAGVEMPPDACAEAEDAKQDKHATTRHDQPMRQKICQQRLGADAACHRDETRPHPCRIGPFSGEYSAVGSEFSSPVGAILDARRTALHWAALSFIWTALSFSLPVFSTVFGLAPMFV